MTVSPPGVEPLDILLVIRSCAEHYPPTINQANLLAESGLRVGVIDLSVPEAAEALSAGVRRWRVHRMWNSKLERPYPLWKRWANWLRFRNACRRVIAGSHPRVVIAYDTLGSLFVPPSPARHRTIYHFHELSGPEAGEGFGPRRARARAAKSSRNVDLVVFSDSHRAEIFQQRAGLRETPQVVMNCPRRMTQPPSSTLRKQLAQSGQDAGALVCYMGSIGADQGLPEAALSMRQWPSDSKFVLIGGASEPARKAILAAAASAGSADRVIFLGLHSHQEALALAAGADAGLALIQPNNESWLYSAGAINKRFEYMALGLPQITNQGPGVAEIVEEGDCGFCVDSKDPEAIGTAVRRLLQSGEIRDRMSRNAREQHLSRYNYELQFAGVADWIRGQTTPAVKGNGFHP